MKKKVFSNNFILIYSLILFFFVISFIYNDLTHFYINPITDKFENFIIFGDWTYVIDSAICHKKGADLFINNNCDVTNRPYHYGSILLFLPFIEKFYNFYYLFFPLVSCFLVISFLTYYFKPQKIKDFFIVFLLVASTPLMLSFERANIELLIFLILILISYVRKTYVIHSLILLATSMKFYPFVSSIILISKKKNITFFLNILIFGILLFSIFYIERDNLIKIYSINETIQPQSVDRVGMYLFSFQLLPRLAESISLHLKQFNADYCYIVISLLLMITFFYSIVKNVSWNSKKVYLINLDLDKFEDRLFLISSVMLITIYFTTMSYLYKEIYFLGLLPFLKKNFFKGRNIYIKLIYKLVLLKFILLTFLWIIQTTLFSTSVFIKGFNILTKGIIDNILIIFLVLVLIDFLKENIKLRFKF